MDLVLIYFILNVATSVIGVTITLVGTILNIFTVYICTRKSLWYIPQFQFVIYMSIADSISLYFWNISEFTITFFGAAVGDFNEIACKTTSFLQYFSTQSSVYVLVYFLKNSHNKQIIK